MAFIAESRRNKFFFGTEQKSGFIPTPNRGADVSPTGWEAGGTFLNGGGFQQNSFGSHKNYIFEWPASSSRQVAQLMKSYADGTYGRGLIYFIDPLTWTTNMLPAQWADPSMGLGYEGTSLVYGVDPVSVPTSGWESNDLPVNSAYYDLAGVAAGWRGKEEAVFIPIPTGYTLSLGSFHSQTGTGRVYYREQATNGALGNIADLVPLANNSDAVVNTFISGANLAGVWLYVGKSGGGAGSVTLTGMVGRLIESVKTVSTQVAQNLFTNPRLVGDGTWAEVRRNLFPNPGPGTGTAGWAAQGGASSQSWTADGVEYVLNGNAFAQIGGSSTSYVQIGEIPAGASRIFGSIEVEALDTAIVIQPLLNWRNSSGQVYQSYTAPSQEIVPGVPVMLALEDDVPAGATHVGVRVGLAGVAPPAGSRVLLRKMYVSTQPGPYFDGGTPDFTVDPDMRQRWLGDENASESVMEIEQVAGFVTNEVIAGVSEVGGKPAVRLIATDAVGAAPWAGFIVPVSARGLRTLVGTVHQIEPMPSPSSPLLRGALSFRQPTIYSDSAPNEAGSTALRLETAVPFSSTYQARIGHGGAKGSPDVWWTDIGLFAGVYDGPAFAGDTGAVVINGHNLRTQWDGTPDNSTSSAWTMTPEFDRLKEGPWIGGQGHSGCRFVGKPTYMNNTGVDGGQVSFAASFREVGQWIYG